MKGVLLDQLQIHFYQCVSYPVTIKAVKALYNPGQKLVVVSNNSGRVTKAIDYLEGQDFPHQ